jgi:sirohydrochlorin cobaltochelatase
MKSALVLFAHGSRDPEWAAPFRNVQQRVAAKSPQLVVELAFLELMKPSLPEAADRLAAAGCEHITIAPLFMAQGAHLKRDLGRLMDEVRARHPRIELSLLPPLGEVDPVIDAMSAWLAEHGSTKS